MIAVIRLRGGMKMRQTDRDTLKVLGLTRVNTLTILPNRNEVIRMVRKVESFVTWGDLAEGMDIKSGTRLAPPKGGLRSIKVKYPKGDLGYRGKHINDLINRMI